MKKLVTAALLSAAACTPTPDPAPDAARDAGRDIPRDGAASPDLGREVGAGDVADAGGGYVHEQSLPDSEVLGSRRGFHVARGIIHAHVIHSHDACNGQPEDADGVPNERCLDAFRDAVCRTRQDFVFLTDHEELAARKAFDTLLMMRGDDEAVSEDGQVVAARVACADGFRPMLLPGGEFGTMPVGMREHLPGTIEEREAAYEEVTPERVQSLQALGAVVLQAHAESRDREELRALGLDGIEVYQLHANLAPDIREDWLGLDPTGFATSLVPFMRGEGVPDLFFMAFYDQNRPSVAHFDALVADGQQIVGVGGTDCHQNVLVAKMSDGERVDSYRRMMRWFTNHLLVDADTPEAYRQALRDARAYIAFELFGTPLGFDFRGEAANGVAEIGQRVSLSDGAKLVLQAPTVHGLEADVPVRLEILEILAEGAETVAEGTGTLEYVPPRAGAYRARVWIQPTHLRPLLGERTRQLADQEYVWVWANPVYVDP